MFRPASILALRQSSGAPYFFHVARSAASFSSIGKFPQTQFKKTFFPIINQQRHFREIPYRVPAPQPSVASPTETPPNNSGKNPGEKKSKWRELLENECREILDVFPLAVVIMIMISIYYLTQEDKKIDPTPKKIDPPQKKIDPQIDALRHLLEVIYRDKSFLETKNALGRTPLLQAAALGQLAIVQSLISLGADMHASTSEGKYCLMLAIEGGHVETAQWLIDVHGSTLAKQYDNYWNYPIHYAVAAGNLNLAKRLVNKYNNLNQGNYSEQETPFLVAARCGHLHLVQALIDFKNAKTYTEQNTGLLVAAQHGHTEIVNWLIDNKHFPIDIQNYYKNTPLMLAIINGHANTVKSLLQRGASLGIQNSANQIPEQLAAALVDSNIRHEIQSIIQQHQNVRLRSIFNP